MGRECVYGYKLKEEKFRLMEEILHWGGWWDTGTGCPGREWVPQSWRCSKPSWTGHWNKLDGWPYPWQGWMVFKVLGPFQPLDILWFCDSVCLAWEMSVFSVSTAGRLLCLVPQGTSAPKALFQPQVMFHRLERWKTSSPRQQFPSFWLTGHLQLSDVPVVARAATGSRFPCWGWFCRCFIYHRLELGAISRRIWSSEGSATGNNFGVFLQFSVKYQEW